MCNGDFTARLGQAGQPGLLDAQARLTGLQAGTNPYVTGTALPANAPVFAGRKTTLHQILSVLRAPGKPACVSLLGERRIGKSSLLNQVYEALAAEPGLVAIRASALNWNQNSRSKEKLAMFHIAWREGCGNSLVRFYRILLGGAYCQWVERGRLRQTSTEEWQMQKDRQGNACGIRKRAYAMNLS